MPVANSFFLVFRINRDGIVSNATVRQNEPAALVEVARLSRANPQYECGIAECSRVWGLPVQEPTERRLNPPNDIGGEIDNAPVQEPPRPWAVDALPPVLRNFADFDDAL